MITDFMSRVVPTPSLCIASSRMRIHASDGPPARLTGAASSLRTIAMSPRARYALNQVGMRRHLGAQLVGQLAPCRYKRGNSSGAAAATWMPRKLPQEWPSR